MNNNPPLPSSNISEGPVGQLDEIKNLFKVNASSKTFGRPSNIELNINTSDFLIYAYGYFLKSTRIINRKKTTVGWDNEQ